VVRAGPVGAVDVGGPGVGEAVPAVVAVAGALPADRVGDPHHVAGRVVGVGVVLGAGGADRRGHPGQPTGGRLVAVAAGGGAGAGRVGGARRGQAALAGAVVGPGGQQRTGGRVGPDRDPPVVRVVAVDRGLAQRVGAAGQVAGPVVAGATRPGVRVVDRGP